MSALQQLMPIFCMFLDALPTPRLLGHTLDCLPYVQISFAIRQTLKCFKSLTYYSEDTQPRVLSEDLSI